MALLTEQMKRNRELLASMPPEMAAKVEKDLKDEIINAEYRLMNNDQEVRVSRVKGRIEKIEDILRKKQPINKEIGASKKSSGSQSFDSRGSPP